MPDSAPSAAGPSLFVTTHWSVVLAAKDKSSPDSAAALEALCRAYWYPLYALVRRQGHPASDAQDLTQEFFARLLAKDGLEAGSQWRLGREPILQWIRKGRRDAGTPGH